MKKTLLSIFALCGISTAITAQTFEWANQTESTNTSQGLSVSSNGNDVYSTGSFTGIIDLNTGTAVQRDTANGSRDVYIQKVDQNGNFLWGKTIGGTGNDFGRRINDYGSTVIISGTFSNTVDFDPGSGVELKTSFGDYDVFVLALDNNGDFLWVQTFGGNDAEIFGGQEKDNTNNIVITGGYKSNMSVPIGSSTTTLSSIGGYSDVFVIKMALATGAVTWAKSTGGSDDDAGTAIAIKPNNNILVGGKFRTSFDADPGSANYNLSGSTGLNVFLLELNSSGNFVEAIATDNGTSDIEVYDMDLDVSGNIYMTGYFKSTVDFDPKSGVTNLTSNGTLDCYVVKLSSTRDLIWARSFGGMNIDQCFDIEVGDRGEVYTAGRFMDVVDFDPSSTGTSIVNGNAFDIFIHKLDSAGDFELVYAYGDNDLYGESARGLDFDANRNLYVTGAFVGTEDFDLGADSTILTSISATNTSSFLMKYKDPMVAGTKEITQKPTVKLYPNPVQNQLFVELDKGEITSARVIDVSGKTVKYVVNNNLRSIDVSDLKQGVYIITVYTETGIINSRFVKQ